MGKVTLNSLVASNKVPPRDDETLSSYINRILKINCCTVRNVTYITGGTSEKDLFLHAQEVLDDFGIHIDLADMINDMTLYPLVSGTVNWNAQMAMLTRYQPEFEKYSKLFHTNINLDKGRMICPECAEEDISNFGYWCFHRAHQAPGVCRCWKHGCKLIDAENEITDSKESKNDESDKTKALQIRYAVFCKYLLEKGLDGTRSENALMVTAAINERFETRKQCIQWLTDNGYSDFLGKELKSAVKSIGTNESLSFSSFHLLALLMIFCMDDVLRERTDEMQFSVSKDIKLLDLRTNMAVVKHKCGAKLIIPPSALNYYISCPSCSSEKTAEEEYKAIISHVNPGYKLLTPFKTPAGRITLQHECGRVYTRKAESYLFPVKCDCQKGISYDEANRRVKDKGFKLLSAELGRTMADTIIRYKCPVCGNIMTKSLALFVSRPTCTECSKKAVIEKMRRSPEEYKKLVKNLVGDEYTPITAYTKSSEEIEMRHNVCGHITKMSANDFLFGRRCEICGQPYGDEFTDYVEKATSGRYEVIKQKRPSPNYMIIDNETGKITKDLPKALILQEIRRPTQSDIIPLDDEVRQNVRNIPMGILEYIRHTAIDNITKDFTADDIADDTYDKNEIENRLRFLRKRGELAKVGEGVYHWMRDTDFDLSRIVPEKTVEIRTVILNAAKQFKDAFTIDELSDITGYRKDQVASALDPLTDLGEVHRLSPGTYRLGNGENYTYLPERVMKYILEHYSDRPFKTTDIIIEDIPQDKISHALKNLARKEKIKRIKKGIYVLPDINEEDYIDDFKTVNEYVLEIISGDIEKDYSADDIPETENFDIDSIKKALLYFCRRKKLYRVARGTYHSADDKNFDRARIFQPPEQTLKETVYRLIQNNGAMNISSISDETGHSKDKVRNSIEILVREKKIHRTVDATYAFGPGQNHHEVSFTEMLKNTIRNNYSDGSEFNSHDVADRMNIEYTIKINYALKEICNQGLIKRTGRGIYKIKKVL